jgi:hypothetical protein
VVVGIVVVGIGVTTGQSHLSPPIGKTKPPGQERKISPLGVQSQ